MLMWSFFTHASATICAPGSKCSPSPAPSANTSTNRSPGEKKTPAIVPERRLYTLAPGLQPAQPADNPREISIPGKSGGCKPAPGAIRFACANILDRHESAAYICCICATDHCPNAASARAPRTGASRRGNACRSSASPTLALTGCNTRITRPSGYTETTCRHQSYR